MADSTTMSTVSLDNLCINTVRTLAMDAVQAANSGHPGTPMALAPLCYVLWTRHLRHNPSDPSWPDRDRFVLSCGHASMLLYSLLHLTGYDLSLDDLKAFRQVGSKTPGHPEFAATPGVETTTGPLGQGLANAVGMALVEKHLAAVFNRDGHDIVCHWTYVVASDGDLMEGISHEAASLAGHLGLGKLIGFYDDNRITIDGGTDLSYSDDAVGRFTAYGWHVQTVDDGNDLPAIDAAIATAREERRRPSLIVIRTHIGYGSPNKQDSASAHGAPLGADEVRLTKRNLDWPAADEAFVVPAAALAEWRKCRDRGSGLQGEWEAVVRGYSRAFPDLFAEFERRMTGDAPPAWEEDLPTFDPADGAVATRGASGKVLNLLSSRIPEMIGGSADLAGSVKTELKGEPVHSADDPAGRNLFFGIREHGMAGVMNGMSLHGGVRPYGGTFLIFSDYMRPSIRLAAMMGQPVIYLFSHDSIGLGEDGPTHQPVETLAALRVIPNMTVIRPADANETVEAWRVALDHRSGPIALVLTRQGVPVLDRGTLAPVTGVRRGAYILAEPEGGTPNLILLASGSEVSLALDARRLLEDDGASVRVVNMASMEIFARQSPAYRREVLPDSIAARVAVEAAHPMPWYQWVGSGGAVVGLDRFGESGKYQEVYRTLGITAERVAEQARALLRRA